MPTKHVVLLAGVPASGKSWVCEQLASRFLYVPHDDFMDAPGDAYVRHIFHAARTQDRPVLAETPFSVSKIREPLEAHGLFVTVVYLRESERVLRERWHARGLVSAPTIAGHVKRQETYRVRALETGAFMGTSAQVLTHLQSLDVGAFDGAALGRLASGKVPE
jgi:hypothetical protein